MAKVQKRPTQHYGRTKLEDWHYPISIVTVKSQKLNTAWHGKITETDDCNRYRGPETDSHKVVNRFFKRKSTQWKKSDFSTNGAEQLDSNMKKSRHTLYLFSKKLHKMIHSTKCQF